MSRQNFLDDEPWDEFHEDHDKMRTRIFDRRRGAMLGASLHELLPGSEGFWLHAHYGSEEMFFVVSGTPTLRNGTTAEQLSPGDVVYCRRGGTVSTRSPTPRMNRRASLQSRPGGTRTSSRIRSPATHG